MGDNCFKWNQGTGLKLSCQLAYRVRHFTANSNATWTDFHITWICIQLFSKQVLAEVVKSTSLSQCLYSVSIIVINQNCQKQGHFRVDPQFFQADTPFFAVESFLPYIICIRGLPVMWPQQPKWLPVHREIHQLPKNQLQNHSQRKVG